jgi:hypothetical protein
MMEDERGSSADPFELGGGMWEEQQERTRSNLQRQAIIIISVIDRDY